MSPPFHIMARTYTEQALHIVERQLQVSKKDGTAARNRGIEFRPNGYIFAGNKRISKEIAVTTLAQTLEIEDKPQVTKKTKSSGITWDKLNQATKDFFFGGQRFSWWLIAFSLVATTIGSSSFVKYSKIAY